MEDSTQSTKDVITQFGKSESDTGNPKVQVALLTKRIRELTEHVKKTKKDFHSRLGLTRLVSKRRKILNYLSRKDLAGYRSLVKELNLRH